MGEKLGFSCSEDEPKTILAEKKVRRGGETPGNRRNYGVVCIDLPAEYIDKKVSIMVREIREDKNG